MHRLDMTYVLHPVHRFSAYSVYPDLTPCLLSIYSSRLQLCARTCVAITVDDDCTVNVLVQYLRSLSG